jgi:hypothetical protein
MKGSLNTSSTLSVEKEFIGMKSELGREYAKSCLIAFHGKNPIGITMPHIEQGTVDEGRLFYFGLLPEYRGKGWGDPFTNFLCTSLKIWELHITSELLDIKISPCSASFRRMGAKCSSRNSPID